MVTRLTYTMTRGEDGYVARCEELSVESTGRSPETSVEAVGPPSRPPAPPIIELVAKGQVELQDDPQSPGDSPAAQRA
jgi:hypothetical protein